jgi:hypothetical protein
MNPSLARILDADRGRHRARNDSAIEEPVLEDLVRRILGRDSAFLKRGRLAGLRSRASS